jgi:primosomal protein N' (replication factor Y)
VTDTIQHDLFENDVLPKPPTAGLFAEVVFDLPVDQAYSYAVPESLENEIAVGKRVLAPFGKGGAGHCGLLRAGHEDGSGPPG